MPLPDQLFLGLPIHIDLMLLTLSFFAAAINLSFSFGRINVSGINGFPRIALAQLVLYEAGSHPGKPDTLFHSPLGSLCSFLTSASSTPIQ